MQQPKATNNRHNEPKILKLAISSRLLTLTLTLVFRTIVQQPYDTSAELDPPCLVTKPSSPPIISSLFLLPQLTNAVVWDSVYFIRIAQCGYEYEQFFAFFPLLPILISLLARTVFVPLVWVIGERGVLVVSGLVITNMAFVFAALYLYRLSCIILKDPKAAFWASVLFCFNPASIFYSSIYTESLYAFFSIGGLYHLYSGSKNIAVLWIALSGCTRSNGVLNAGYFCFQSLHQAYDALFVKKRIYLAVQVIVVAVLRSVCIFIPFIAFQAYGYCNLCLGRSQDEMRPWCKARVPLLYNFIQSHYWGVGFLKYFQLKQLPNFLLASPILSLAVCTIFCYIKSQPEIFFSLGFVSCMKKNKSTTVLSTLEDTLRLNNASILENSSSEKKGIPELRQRQKIYGKEKSDRIPVGHEQTSSPGYMSPIILPYILHLGFLTATAFFVMHVQVATRFLSASPPLYWHASYISASPGSGKRWGYIIWMYSSAYILLGSLLFSNFYPFT